MQILVDDATAIAPYGEDGSSVGTGYVVPTAAQAVVAPTPNAFAAMVPAGVSFVGCKPSDPVKTGDKFIVTWTWTLAGWFEPVLMDGVLQFDHKVREALPALGFTPVSNPAASAGDEVIIYAIRLNAVWGAGQNVAQVVAKCNDLPLLSGGAALGVSRIAKVSESASSAETAEDVEEAREGGNEEAQKLTGPLDFDFCKTFPSVCGLGRGVAWAIGGLAVIALVGGLVYLSRK